MYWSLLSLSRAAHQCTESEAKVQHPCTLRTGTWACLAIKREPDGVNLEMSVLAVQDSHLPALGDETGAMDRAIDTSVLLGEVSGSLILTHGGVSTYLGEVLNK